MPKISPTKALIGAATLVIPLVATAIPILTDKDVNKLPDLNGSLGIPMTQGHIVKDGKRILAAEIVSVSTNSPWANKDLRPGDKIIALNGFGFTSQPDFVTYVRSLKVGTPVALTIKSPNGTERTIASTTANYATLGSGFEARTAGKTRAICEADVPRNTLIAVSGLGAGFLGWLAAGAICSPALALAPADVGTSFFTCTKLVTASGALLGAVMADRLIAAELKACHALPNFAAD